MTPGTRDLLRAAGAVRFDGGQVLWMGEPVRGRAQPGAGTAAVAAEAGTAAVAAKAGGGAIGDGESLQRALAATLYRCWYPFDRCRSLTDATEPPRTAASSRLVRPLVAAAAPHPTVTVRVGQSPGWVSYLGRPARGNGEAAAPEAAPGQDVRLYWNVSAAGAPALAAAITEALGRLALPFGFKVRFGDAPWSRRADVAVLYVDEDGAQAAEGDLVRIHRLLRPQLRWSRPALTDRLSHGLSLARQPSGLRTSFGLHRCDLVARAIVRAHLQGGAPETWVEAVEETFRQAGVCREEPWREERHRALELPTVRRTAAEPLAPASCDWQGQAQRIGREIASAALWDGNRCTWLDVDPDEARLRPWRPLPARLYDGNAGVGWALATVAAASGDDLLSRTARACLATALDTAPRPPAPGLLTGSPGVALGVAVGGRLLGDDGLLAAGRALALTVAGSATGMPWPGGAAPPGPGGGAGSPREGSGADASGMLDLGALDLTGGLAGTLLALTSLAATIAPGGAGADPALRQAIARTARRLGRAVEQLLDSPAGAPAVPAGVAHGAAGIAWALAEAGALIGDPAPGAHAIRLCDAERRWLDPAAGNWADTRTVPRGHAAERRPPGTRHDRFYWCHGAPGIAVTRRRVATLTGDPGAAADAALALRSTIRAAEAFPTAGSDTSLCHGAAGLAGMLSWLVAGGHPTSGEADAALRDRARAAASGLAAAAVRAYGGRPPWAGPWGLLTGAAGVALAALSAAGVAGPSPILPFTSRGPAGWATGREHQRHARANERTPHGC